MKFGVRLGQHTALPKPDDQSRFRDLIRMTEDYGVSAIGIHDTSFIDGDAFVRATLIASAAQTALVGLRPTNPLTREPQIMAGFLASIDSLTNGRAFMDIASGDSAVYNIGLKPASRARIESYINTVRDLLSTGEGTFLDRPQRIRWSDAVTRPRVPISICAEGPKMLHLAGRIGDGVVAGTGLTESVVKDTLSRIAAGAVEADRNPDDLDVWFVTRSAFDVDRERALAGVKGSVSSILNHSMRFGLEGKNVPEGLLARVQEYVDGYVLYEHIQNQGNNPRRMDELGLTDYAMERFALAGDVNDWVSRIEQLANHGIKGIWFGPGHYSLDQQIAEMKLIGEKVLPHFL
ncbi:MAG: LLM class flavin-dependent oxidoreductase [Pseudomonadota bacterium]